MSENPTGEESPAEAPEPAQTPESESLPEPTWPDVTKPETRSLDIEPDTIER